MKRVLIIPAVVLGVVGMFVPTTAAETAPQTPADDQVVIAPVQPETSRRADRLPVAGLPGLTPTDRIATPQPTVDTGRAADPLLGNDGGTRANGPVTLSAPLITWNGQGGRVPNDTVGDVGPNHFVQMVQESFQIWTKDGTSVAGPANLSSLWLDPVNDPRDEACEFDRGDPIVLYDNLADRWLLSQFQPKAGEPGGQFTNFLCIAISQTPDPTGAYFLYAFDVQEFPDYFKIGAWTDGYYMSANGPGDVPVWVFERDAMLAGGAAGAVKLGTVPNLAGVGFDVLLPSDIDGSTPPPVGTPASFYRQVNGDVSGGADRLQLYEATIDWTTSTGTLSAPIDVPIAAFDGALCGYSSFGCVPQPGTASVLDPVNEVGMFRFPYRNYGTREVLAGNFVVDVNGADGHGVRWFVLERTGGGAWTVGDQGTHAPQPAPPAGFVHRFMGSLAMDRNGNLAVAYTASGPDVFPSARYAGRAAGDPAGTLGAAEQTMAPGLASATNPAKPRWGDYYALTVDPVDDCTFWYTGDYLSVDAVRQSVIGSFRFSDCSPLSASVEADATNLTGDPHTFTLSAFADTPMGTVPANGATFNYTWTGTTAAAPPATCTATAATNTCTVTVTSATAGEGTITIDTITATVNGTTFTNVTPATATGGSLTATKKWVAVSASVEADATNLTGDPHTFTLSAFADTPMGTVPANGATFNYTWTGTTAAAPPATCTATAATNTCTVTVTSATAGEGTITIDTITATVNGTTFTNVTPATATGGSLTATKKWVAVSASVEADATNLTGDPHTFTLSAFADTPMGTVPANGATFNYTWTGTTAAAPPATCTATAATNTCTVTVTSATAGEGTITIDTITATVNGTTFTNVTPATATGGSLTATKKWVAVSASVEADATNLTGDPHTFTLSVFADTPMGTVPANGATFNYTWTGTTAAAPPATCTATAATNTCTVTVTSATAGEGTITIDTITATVNGTTFTNVTPATATGGSLTATKKWVDPSADLGVTIEATVMTPGGLTGSAAATSPVSAEVGDTIVFSFAVSNAGPDPAVDAVLTGVFPAVFGSLSVVDDDVYTCQLAAQTMTCTLAQHPVGTVATIVVSVSVDGGAGTAVITTGAVTSSTPDPALGNNTAAFTVNVAAAPPPTTAPPTTAPPTTAPPTTAPPTTAPPTTAPPTTAPPTTAAPTAAGPPGDLPATGSNSAGMAPLALALLGLGTVTTIVTRRRGIAR